MQQPGTVQQQFLHLFASRHLLKQNMIHKNIQNCLQLLPGSFASRALILNYTSLCIDNKLDIPALGQPLLQLIQGWINYYPSLKGKKKILIGQIILQQSITPQDIQGYDLYLHYLNLISVDLWKLLFPGSSQKQFLKQKPLKQEVQDIRTAQLRHLDPSDLLTFVSSCIPKTLLNIILQKNALPINMKNKFDQLQCLYVCQGMQYYLHKSEKLAYLLKTIMIIIAQLELGPHLMKMLMIVAIRYYYIFHYNRKYNAAQIFVYCYNKLSDNVRRGLTDQFTLFLTVIQKLGKNKFLSFLSQNSAYLKIIIDAVSKKPTIGYTQELASPYNTIGIGQTIIIQRGKSTERYFQVLQEHSIFYYRVNVVNHDITIRLFYLGQIGSRQQSKTLLFENVKKSGVIKSCVNVKKKGLYVFQFDNSYSWINSKAIQYQNMIYSPTQIKSTQEDQWIQYFYCQQVINDINSNQDVYFIESKKGKINTANLSRNSQGHFTLLHSSPSSSYQYETDSPERMKSKLVELQKEHKQLEIQVEGKKVQDLSELDQFLKQSIVQQNKIIQVKNEQDNVQKEQEKLKEKEKEQENMSHQVVEKEVDKSLIISSVEKQQVSVPQSKGKEIISGETPNFYEED